MFGLPSTYNYKNTILEEHGQTRQRIMGLLCNTEVKPKQLAPLRFQFLTSMNFRLVYPRELQKSATRHTFGRCTEFDRMIRKYLTIYNALHPRDRARLYLPKEDGWETFMLH